MTTTVPAMEETLRRLHTQAPWCRAFGMLSADEEAKRGTRSLICNKDLAASIAGLPDQQASFCLLGHRKGRSTAR